MNTAELTRARLKPAFTVAEVARAWGKVPQFIRNEIHAGRLTAYRIGVEGVSSSLRLCSRR